MTSEVSASTIPISALGFSLNRPLRQQLTTIHDEISALQDAVALLAARKQIGRSTAIANPPGTASATDVMLGINVVMDIPADGSVTRTVIVVTGQIANSNNGGQSIASLRYDTGPPPVNGDPGVGDPIGQSVQYVATSGGGSFVPFSQNALLENLTPGESYWIGIALRATGGTASLKNLQVTGFSLLDTVTL